MRSFRRRSKYMLLLPAAVVVLAIGGMFGLQLMRQNSVESLPPLAPSITEFTIPTANSKPFLIAAGPDGALYFTESNANRIGKITPNGVISEFPLSTATAGGITVGNDGFVYFAKDKDAKINRICRVRTDFDPGTFAEVQLAPGSMPDGIMTAADGNIYFTELGTAKLGRLPLGFGPDATPVELAIPGKPVFLASAGDGNIYFTEYDGNKIGYVPMGFTSTTPFVESGFTGSNPHGICVGPDGNIWFAAYAGDRVGRIAKGFAPGTAPTGFSLPSGARPIDMVSGPDGAVYVTESSRNEIARVTPAGTITHLNLPPGCGPWGIAAGFDGNVWFCEANANKIARINLTKTPIAGNARRAVLGLAAFPEWAR